MTGMPSLMGYLRPHLEQTIFPSFRETSLWHAGQAKMANKSLSIIDIGLLDGRAALLFLQDFDEFHLQFINGAV